MTSYIVPFLLLIIFVTAVVKKVDVFGEFLEGASENLKTSFEILPTLVALVLSVGMLRSSGVIELLSQLASPLLEFTGFPEECLPLALIRPISGSGATAVFESILTQNSPDSFAGRVASIMVGSTETTFYTIAVYYGVTKVKNSKHTLVCALFGDLVAITGSFLITKYFFGI
ncbi:MAG: nucleoside recognition domain-containing protein [Oscillospiraceae bacterium]|nr:nucleoside recognition domain-containing protein [Oscillospiraceae bacterium]